MDGLASREFLPPIIKMNVKYWKGVYKHCFQQSQVGVIEFSDAAFVQVPLGGYSKEKLLTDVGITPYQGGGTEIGLVCWQTYL